MQKEIEADGEKDEKAYDKFMCYCDGNSGSMSDSAAESTKMIATLASKLDALKAEKSQMDQELKGHQESRAAAKQDLQKAATIRSKENDDFVALSTDQATNIAAMEKAIAALEKGMGSFMQMPKASSARVQTAVEQSSQVDDFQKQTILDLLQGKQGVTDSSAQITGMLKAMLEEMSADAATTTKDEAASVAGDGELKAAKTAEVNAATSAIEKKTKRSGELAVEIAQTDDDLEDTKAEVAETEKFLGDLGAQCASKKAEWAERQKMRAEEVSAISDAIAILNDDDSLDLFKKTAFTQTKPSMRFLQRDAQLSKTRRARHLVMALVQTGRSHESMLTFIATALKSKKVDFSKISGMIDGMVDVLSKEQDDDDAQKSFCSAELEKAAGEKADSEEKLASLAASLEDMAATSATLSEEIAALQKEIVALDKAVAEATEQRKSEHAAFVQAQAENQAATALVEKAKNRLFKVYRPGLYKEEARRELTEEERILVNSGQPDPRDAEEAFMNAGGRGGIQNTGIVSPIFAQVRVASNDAVVPPPPPETFGAYQKKEGKSNGVIALMDMMIEDLKTDHTEAKHAEETAQKDYETLMATSQESREKMAASITGKESSSAEWTEKIENAKTDQASTTEALGKLNELIAGLHAECDFLIANYDTRKEARTNEIEGLKNAKAVLSGASFE